MPNRITIALETKLHRVAGMPRKRVVALRSREKIKTETARLTTITSGCLSEVRLLLLAPWRTLPPTTTGKTGSMHGAATVNTPATNEMIASSITEAAPLSGCGISAHHKRRSYRSYFLLHSLLRSLFARLPHTWREEPD